MKAISITILVSMLLVIPAIASEATEDTGGPVPADISGHTRGGPIWDGPKDVLWDNGPIVTSYGTGVGGADESIIDPVEINNGWGCQWTYDYRITDDFEIPAGETWEISSITLFGYQTGSGPPSTIVGCYIEIFDNPPEYGTTIYGDLFTNVLTSTSWMNCYRLNQAGSGTNTDRPIMANVCEYSSPITLTAGTYWLCWQMDGIGASGPWNPPITINGQLATGDALQYASSATWDYITDNDSGEMKGMPFILEGSIAGALENETWATIKTVF